MAGYLSVDDVLGKTSNVVMCVGKRQDSYLNRVSSRRER